MRACPVCGHSLKAEERGQTQIDVCPNGCGVFLDKGELFELTERARYEGSGFPWAEFFRREQKPPVDPDRRVLCPVSGEEMQITRYKGVHIDVSPAGVWLDAGELEAILNNLRLDPAYVRGIALRLGELKL